MSKRAVADGFCNPRYQALAGLYLDKWQQGAYGKREDPLHGMPMVITCAVDEPR